MIINTSFDLIGKIKLLHRFSFIQGRKELKKLYADQIFRIGQAFRIEREIKYAAEILFKETAFKQIRIFRQIVFNKRVRHFTVKRNKVFAPAVFTV